MAAARVGEVMEVKVEKEELSAGSTKSP